MSNVESSSTNENPRSLRNIFLDLKSDLGLISESGNNVKKRFEEYLGPSSEFSGNSNSNFDDELSLMLKNTNKNGNLLDVLNKKYLIGYAISEAFSGTDLDAYTLFHLWNTKRTSQKSLLLSDHPKDSSDENMDLNKSPECTYNNMFVIFHQQLYYSRQSKLKLIDRTRPIFKIPPQDNSLVHAIDPKTTSLVILASIYGLKNVKFLGLKNHSNHAKVPGPYLSLFSMDSKTDFMTCIDWIQNSVFNKENDAGNMSNCSPNSSNQMNSSNTNSNKGGNAGNTYGNSNYSNFDGYLTISYFLYELDYIYSYILVHDECYKRYTEPILLKSFTGWIFGKISLLLYSYRMRSYYKNVSLSEILSRLNVILSLICKIFSEFKSTHRQSQLDKYTINGFNFYSFASIVYSYIYAILSIPIQLLPWERYVLDKPAMSKSIPGYTTTGPMGSSSNNNSGNATTKGHSGINDNSNNRGNNDNSITSDSNNQNGNANIANDNTHNVTSNNTHDIVGGISYVSIHSEGDTIKDDNGDQDKCNSVLNGPTVPDGVAHFDKTDVNNDINEDYNIINMSVHNEFAETAADSTCVENTRRHDNLMTYVIGIINGEGNWIKKKEKFVDVIDTYKLGLSWYRRPSFSNTLYNTSYKAWPIALYYYNMLIEPCGRAFFVWYWKNVEAWNSSNIWSYRIKMSTRKRSPFSQFLKNLVKRDRFYTDSNLQLKRQVSLRLRDAVSFVFDVELELKRALLYS